MLRAVTAGSLQKCLIMSLLKMMVRMTMTRMVERIRGPNLVLHVVSDGIDEIGQGLGHAHLRLQRLQK